MGRAPCCEKVGLKKGAWSREEDRVLISYVKRYGHGNWRNLPRQAGLLRCGKSCRLRWVNYLRPDIKRGNLTAEEEETIIRLHEELGNRWSAIAAKLPGRTDNEIKNVWNTHLKKRVVNHTSHQDRRSSKKKPEPEGGASSIAPRGSSSVAPSGASSSVAPSGASSVAPSGASSVAPSGASSVAPSGASSVAPSGARSTTAVASEDTNKGDHAENRNPVIKIGNADDTSLNSEVNEAFWAQVSSPESVPPMDADLGFELLSPYTLPLSDYAGIDGFGEVDDADFWDDLQF